MLHHTKWNSFTLSTTGRTARWPADEVVIRRTISRMLQFSVVSGSSGSNVSHRTNGFGVVRIASIEESEITRSVPYDGSDRPMITCDAQGRKPGPWPVTMAASPSGSSGGPSPRQAMCRSGRNRNTEAR
jgi:hypothetical protein